MHVQKGFADLRRSLGAQTGWWLLGIAVILFIRVCCIGLMGLMPQDAYYHFYGEHLDWSYFDHPPAIAYLLRLFTDLFGDQVFVVKLTNSVVTLLSFWAFYKLAGCFLSARKVPVACILLVSTLMISILSLVSTPDVPLILFWTLSLLALYKAIFLQKPLFWILSGLLMGCAFDSKYTGLFLPVSLVFFMLISPEHRKLFRSGWFWCCIGLFLVTVYPVIWWNWQHHFASFRFQTESRVNTASQGMQLNVKGFLGMLGHQSAVLMPVLFIALLWLVAKGVQRYVIRRYQVPPQVLFLYAFFLPLFVFFLVVSLVYWVKLNWMMPAYISGILLVSMYLKERWIKWQLALSFAVHLALAVEVFLYPFPVKSDDTWFGWKQLSSQVQRVQSQHPGTFIFSADDYKTSAVLNFYSDSMIYSRNVIGKNALQFDYVGTDLNTLAGRNALFLNSVPGLITRNGDLKYPGELPRYFDSVTELDPILIEHRGQPVRKFLVFLCKNYHPKASQQAN